MINLGKLTNYLKSNINSFTDIFNSSINITSGTIDISNHLTINLGSSISGVSPGDNVLLNGIKTRNTITDIREKNSEYVIITTAVPHDHTAYVSPRGTTWPKGLTCEIESFYTEGETASYDVEPTMYGSNSSEIVVKGDAILQAFPQYLIEERDLAPNGVFPVLSVTDSNTLVIDLSRAALLGANDIIGGNLVYGINIALYETYEKFERSYTETLNKPSMGIVYNRQATDIDVQSRVLGMNNSSGGDRMTLTDVFYFSIYVRKNKLNQQFGADNAIFFSNEMYYILCGLLAGLNIENIVDEEYVGMFRNFGYINLQSSEIVADENAYSTYVYNFACSGVFNNLLVEGRIKTQALRAVNLDFTVSDSDTIIETDIALDKDVEE